MENESVQIEGLALNSAEREADVTIPEWVQLTPAGPDIRGRDGRLFQLQNAAGIVAAFNADKRPIVIDIDHASEKARTGDPVPAQGWIEAMEARDGQIWGQVSWTAGGRALMSQQAYRYLSPVLMISKHTGAVHSVRSAGLVHRPNLDMAALNSQTDEEIPPMDEAIRLALGLSAGATSADAVTAINTMKSDHTTALNAAREEVDLTKFVPKTDYDLVVATNSELKQFKDDALEAQMNAVVDQAITDGKIAPASRDHYIASCNAMGLEPFKGLVKTLPVITGVQPKPKAGDTAATALNSEDAYAMKQLGLSAEEFTQAQET